MNTTAASASVATLFSDHEQTQEELLRHTDIAMYQAKSAGRNTMRIFDPKMQDTINARAALQDELAQSAGEAAISFVLPNSGGQCRASIGG